MSAQNAQVTWATPEFRLLCLTGRVEFSDEAAAQATALIAAGQIDWPVFLWRVERHYVAPVVYKNLKVIAGAGVSSKVLDTLRVRSKITAFRCETFAKELARLGMWFDSRGIRTIHYKGAATAQEFYGSVALRSFNDLDFLIDPRDVRAAVGLLEEQGYVNSEKLTDREFTHYVREFKEFLFRKGEVSVEPHWSLAGRRYHFDADFDGFWQRSRTLTVADRELRVMCMEDSLLVLCLVGAKGRWKRLQMVSDLAACINRFNSTDWLRVIRRAESTRTVRILHLGVILAKELSGAALPSDVEQRVYADPVACKLARQVTQSLMHGQPKSRWLPDTPGIFSKLLYQQRESRQDQLLYFWHTTTTPDLFHLHRMPLPRFAHALYRILVPVHDWLVFPAWQLLQAGVAQLRPAHNRTASAR